MSADQVTAEDRTAGEDLSPDGGRFECFDRALEASGKNPAVLTDAGHCRASMGDVPGAREILDRLAGAPLGRAIVCLGLKETDAALEHLRQAVGERLRGLIWLGVDPRFDELHANPEFRAVLASVGLTILAEVSGDPSARST